MAVRIHPTSEVSAKAEVGDGTQIWLFCQVRDGVKIGKGCIFGKGVYLDNDVVIGDRVKIQNNVSLFDGVAIEDDVFLGPSCVFTNVASPRAEVSRRDAYEPTVVRKGATIGANATIRCGIVIGRYAFVGAGAVVTRDVAAHALVVGVPAMQVGWVGRRGRRLSEPDEEGVMRCPESGLRYALAEGELESLDPEGSA